LSSWLFSTKLGKRAVSQKDKTFKFPIGLSGIWKAEIEPGQLSQNQTFHATFRQFCVKNLRSHSPVADMGQESRNGYLPEVAGMFLARLARQV
jgi:hypothetical protein